MPSEIVQTMIVTSVILIIVIAAAAAQYMQVETQRRAAEVAYAVTLLKQVGDFVRTHITKGGEIKVDMNLQYGMMRLTATQPSISLVILNAGGGNITLHQGPSYLLEYQAPFTMYGSTEIYDRGDRLRPYTTSPERIDSIYHYSDGGYTRARLWVAAYVASTYTQGSLSVRVYVFSVGSQPGGGVGGFTLRSETATSEHIRFTATAADIALYVQVGAQAGKEAYRVNAGDLIDLTVNVVKVAVAWST